MKRKTVYTILLVIWMIIIFLFSNQDAIDSQKTSDKITNKVVYVVEHINNQKVDKDITSLVVRKLAHFAEYFILGILVYLTVNSYNIKYPFACSIIFCILFACGDEIHQIFSNNRSPKILDVFIDTCGSLLAFVYKYYNTR